MDKSKYEVDKVLAARGPGERRFYLLKYKGYGPEYKKWSPAQWYLCSDKIIEFCRAKGLADVSRRHGARRPKPAVG